jgi:hypothetical protein
LEQAAWVVLALLLLFPAALVEVAAEVAVLLNAQFLRLHYYHRIQSVLAPVYQLVWVLLVLQRRAMTAHQPRVAAAVLEA